MSSNYSAGQFEQTFMPKRLQMYQVPREPQSGIYPKGSMGSNTSNFVANEHGHILPGVEKSKRSPFGEFVGTWDLPKTIPGPYHVTPMGRTEKSFQTLCAQRDQTVEEIEKARAYQVCLQE
ncbi:unnamed protein product [Adineta steineri]|uniref:Cilia- and flagella-associated protein 126 n=1 Tax=Adineta steineri TaxID=433720 RepID=A0A814F7Y4_9BILA|nr:unnamed protein product [Adineta steineri]CAF0981448.1 unnamed protein product [Adineta steineri]CAF1051567.1 unnamed protein product [Adineta steineri]